MKAAYEYVTAARSKDRQTGLDFINHIFKGFIELHGDRRFADDPSVVGGLAYLDDIPVTVIATEKGRDTKSRIRRNFGMANPEGYRKAQRLMKQAEKFNRPVVCFVDTSGAYPGIGAEERGQGQAIAESIMEMMTLRVPILSVVIGEGGSGGALALAVADEVWMLENATYSVIAPESCANILWRDPDKAAEAAESLRLTAKDVYELGVVERIISEKGGDTERLFASLAADIRSWYVKMKVFTPEELTESRYKRFRRIGVQKTS
ncbi:acetyl-CoA carboxylase carboxyl transferase subunit alpha [Sporobacter termitidis DSM 10068]|uniref:Acetyl-coenzyme A carboxylase carboxyl transferase subunit alpha n=1 Tax=Sporobacter termitidis DSM 10068 TaxID=1123282 RepID=A0A1M5X2R5_9FIRM|nr:acetyl-CoA carboxylase carboxyltransferase subunit alpha [Sporobacter termitidis]SHH94081.1 acetyl-CoA carboxylase carboxyl transferase subunit alpha [Sporobacter termitidis DSM 10068]